MDTDTIWRHVDTERAALADILETQPADAWRVPSLCEAWTVRDVAAHLCLAQSRVRDLVGPALRSGLRYHAIIRDTAIDSPLTHEQIVATLRGFVGSRRKVPGVSDMEPLLDVLVHTQDICVPLDLEAGFSATSPVDHQLIAAQRRELLIELPDSPEVAARAREIQAALAATGQHREVSSFEVLVAAFALTYQATVVHHDRDYDLIAAVSRHGSRLPVASAAPVRVEGLRDGAVGCPA